MLKSILGAVNESSFFFKKKSCQIFFYPDKLKSLLWEIIQLQIIQIREFAFLSTVLLNFRTNRNPLFSSTSIFGAKFLLIYWSLFSDSKKKLKRTKVRERQTDREKKGNLINRIQNACKCVSLDHLCSKCLFNECRIFKNRIPKILIKKR